MFETNKNNTIIVYTDGGSRGNQSKDKSDVKCGYAWTLQYNNVQKIGYASGYGYTNNQMELMAIKDALSNIKNKKLPVILYSDSKYSINALTSWGDSWEKNGWVKKDGKEIVNLELIKEIRSIINEFQFLEFEYVEGHAGNEGNEFVDELLNNAMDKIDEDYKEEEFPMIYQVKYN